MKTQTKTEKHTPTPWTLRTRQIRTWNGYEFKHCNVSITVHELSVKRDPIAGIPASYICADITSVGDANLDFIVRAVNSHEALLEAAKMAADLEAKNEYGTPSYTELKQVWDLAKKAIAQASEVK